MWGSSIWGKSCWIAKPNPSWPEQMDSVCTFFSCQDLFAAMRKKSNSEERKVHLCNFLYFRIICA
jgi:hypothetical protein